MVHSEYQDVKGKMQHISKLFPKFSEFEEFYMYSVSKSKSIVAYVCFFLWLQVSYYTEILKYEFWFITSHW